MPDKSTLDKFLDHLRAFFTTGDSSEVGSGEETAPAASSSAFAERIAQLEQRLDTLAAEKTATEEKLSHTESARRGEQVANFVEALRRRGRFPPAFDRWGVRQFMERLAALDSYPSFASSASREAKEAQEAEEAEEGKETASLLTWFQDFLSQLPAVIEFHELSGASGPALRSPKGAGGSRLVSFTEPQRGMTIDPASIELAERAEALAAAHGIPYAEALTQLREEHRATPTTA